MRLNPAASREQTIRALADEAERTWGVDQMEALSWNVETIGAALWQLAASPPLQELEWEPDFIGAGKSSPVQLRPEGSTELEPRPVNGGDQLATTGPRPDEAIHHLGVVELANRLAARELSPVEVVRALVARVETLEPRLRAWATLDAEGALETAKALERIGPASGSPLYGVPFGVKDIYYTAGLRTEANSPLLAGFVPLEDAEAVRRLRQAGAVLLGKTVTTQFADGDPSETRNPWNLDRSPGGSSAGSAAAVGAHAIPAALGTQTAGSVLRPAGFCGAVGFKPTFGRISRRNVLPFAWSLDTMGAMARSVDDAALLALCMAGFDRADAASADLPVFGTGRRPNKSQPPRLALLATFLERSRPEVAEHTRLVAERFGAAGAEMLEAPFPADLDLALACHSIIQGSEAAELHARRHAQAPDGYLPRLRAIVEIGQLVPAQAYARAQRVRRSIREAVAGLLERVDALLLPTCAHLAPELTTTGDTSFQGVWTMLGLPAITLPSGLSEDRLPFAIQLVGAAWSETTLLDAARWCEAALDPLPAPPI